MNLQSSTSIRLSNPLGLSASDDEQGWIFEQIALQLVTRVRLLPGHDRTRLSASE